MSQGLAGRACRRPERRRQRPGLGRSALGAVGDRFARGNLTAARQELVKAASLQPSNARDLAGARRVRPSASPATLALLELETAQQLDLSSASIGQQIAQAQRAVSQQS